MPKIPKQGGSGHNSDWSHREMRGWSRARGGDPGAGGGGKKKSWLSCGVIALAAATSVLTTVAYGASQII